MIFDLPTLDQSDLDALARIEGLRDELAHQVAVPRRWLGSLRRLSLARAVQASNSIEGINASIEDVVAAGESEEPLDAEAETYEALRGYQSAMTYVLQMTRSDTVAPVDASLIRSLHFMMMSYDLSKNPGLWRPGAIWVEREPDGTVVYEGPDAALVPDLMNELVTSLSDDDGPVVVRAAMAHLNLTMIHPFSDGNGRMARCLQTLVLARERIVAPEFSSIEEYLGRNTQAYYAVLAEVGRGAWHPEDTALPWVRFCLEAHEQQARRLLQRLRDIERLWELCSSLAAGHHLPDRVVPALVDAARGFRLRNVSYRRLVERSEGVTITENTASRDLRAMVDAQLMTPQGERRGRIYVAGAPLRQAWQQVRKLRPAGEAGRRAVGVGTDQFAGQERLPGL
jgi:Fic family protein